MATIWEQGGQPLIDRFTALHSERPMISFRIIAQMLTAEFGVRITRNSAIGKAARLGLPDRLPQAGFATRPPREPRATRTVQRLRKSGSAHHLKVISTFELVDQWQARLADVVPQHIDLQELTSKNCHYPLGDGPYTFCGCEALPGLTYCEPHQRLTHSDKLMTPIEYSQHKRAYAAKMIAEAA